MTRKLLLIGFTLALSLAFANGATTDSSRPGLSAAEVVARCVAARGGLQAWRAVKTISIAGKLGAGGNRHAPLPLPVPGKKNAEFVEPERLAEEAQLPFLMEMERPGKMRFELEFNGQTAVQVYDGTNGWKLRPFLNRHDVEPYTSDELKTASTQTEIDGPLVDYVPKGTRVELDGMDKVDGQDTYKLRLSMKNGRSIHIWIDAKTFLEAKVEGQPRRLDGEMRPVEIYYRDYRSVGGLQIPFVLETKVLPAANPAPHADRTPVPVERIAVEKVEVNPKLDASLFSKPKLEIASNSGRQDTPHTGR